MLWLSIICSYLVVSAHLPLFTDRVPDFTLMRYVVAVWRYGVGVIPVEIFFVVSGYAFFRTYQATWEGYRGKIGRRVRTLIIPYIVWICVTILYKVISGDQISGVDTLLSWFGITSGYPALYVLWYLRDLFLLCLLAPMIYFLMSRRRLAIGLLIALWCLQWVPLAGLSNLVQGLLWFPAGAFVALHISQGTLLRCRRPWVWFVGWLGMIAIVQILRVRTDLGPDGMSPLYVVTGLPILWNLTGTLGNVISETAVAPHIFFVYCAHSFFNITFSKTWTRLFPASETWLIVGFFLVPMLSFISSLLIGKLGRAWFPRLYAFVTGGRGVRI